MGEGEQHPDVAAAETPPRRVKEVLRRFNDWLANKAGMPTAEDRRQFYARWDYAQGNASALRENDPFRDELTEVTQLPSDDPARFAKLLNFAERGSVWSMDQVASHYAHGQGVEVDMDKALEWDRRAFEHGSLDGLLAYGARLVRTGSLDEAEAVFQAGADRGWAPAIYWLAWCILKRSPERATYRRVLPLLKKAVALGSPTAEYALSYHFARGRYGLARIPSGLRLRWKLSGRVLADFEERKQATSGKDRRRLWEM